MFWSKLLPKNQQEIDKAKKRITNLIIPDSYVYLANIIKIFLDDYGFNNSVNTNLPVDSYNNPLPLYTYPAIEYLKSLDFSNKKIFEFGSGNSTLYWLARSMKVISVENNPIWIEKLSPQLKKFSNHQYFEAKGPDYVNSILNFSNQEFDVIIIDGAENRYLCAKNSINKIKNDGLIILDNSDWYPKTAELIRKESNFIQVDFYGFRPSKPNTSVTSLFLGREFNYNNLEGRQPNFAIGGFAHNSGLDRPQ